jgi:Icc-related predicted phosphoesterase
MPQEPYDILIHAGDFSNSGNPDKVQDFIQWISVQPAKHIVVIPGNHDLRPDRWRHLFGPSRINYLEGSSIGLEGLNIFGSPWTPWFCDWEFNFPEKDNGIAAVNHWANIPDNTNILVTHGPPANILDTNAQYIKCGCPYLANRISQLNNLKLHVFGHIHEGYGHVTRDSINYYNASMIHADSTRHYFEGPYHSPIELEI